MQDLHFIQFAGQHEGLFYVTHDVNSCPQHLHVALLVNDISRFPNLDNVPVIFTYSEKTFNKLKEWGTSCIYLEDNFSLSDGDIVYIQLNPLSVTVVYYANSKNNCLFLTSCCNNNCIMCAQPPTKDTINFIAIAKEIIMSLPAPDAITLTGGEPTLKSADFFEILSMITHYWPSTYTTILTNGRLLSPNFIQKLDLLSFNRENLAFGIPLHSDNPTDHDSIAGSKGAFFDTVSGLFNLSSSFYFIELRIVVQKTNIYRLSNIIDYIAMNLPFVGRIVLMQLEPEGYARKNWENLWLPVESYIDELLRAIDHAVMREIDISLYNYQLCSIPVKYRKYARSSISDWKNNFISICSQCNSQHECCGFFSSQDNEKFIGKILPIQNTEDNFV